MNAKDREDLKKACEMLSTVHAIVSQLASNERDKYDNLSEGLQNSERGQALDEAANTLEEQADALEAACNELEALC